MLFAARVLCAAAGLVLLPALTAIAAGADQPLHGMRYLDNGVVRLGIDLDLGGAITWLSPAAGSGAGENVINSFDHGRQVQLSFYSGPIPFTSGDKRPAKHWEHLGWNPIQAGDDFGHGSAVLDESKTDGQLYVKCRPLQWPLDNVPAECIFETWYSLEANRVLVRARLTNARTDTTQYAGCRQELPAVYTNGPLYRLMAYTGDRPFAGEPLTRIEKRGDDPAPWATFLATERWAALVRDDDWGLGVWNPQCVSFAGGFAGVPGKGGAHDTATGYVSPTLPEILDHNITYEYRYVLMLDTLERMRQYVYSQSSQSQSSQPAMPDYRFSHDRQSWIFVNATDAGWPIQGELQVALERPDPQLIGPPAFWQAADVPRLYVDAAYHTQPGRATLFFSTLSDPGFTEDKTVSLAIIADGEFHSYEFDLSACPAYRGAITGLRFDPIGDGRPGDRLNLRSITPVPPNGAGQP